MSDDNGVRLVKRMMKLQLGSQEWMFCATLADKTLLPQPDLPNTTSGSVDGLVT